MSVFKDKQKTKDGRQWRFKVYYHNAEGKLVPYTSKRYLLEKEAKAEERVFVLNKNNPIKKRFDVVADGYFKEAETRIKESTWVIYLSLYERNIKPYFKNKFIDEISVLDIENWKSIIAKNNKKISSCNQYYVIFKEIFSYANRRYELNYNPVELSGRFKQRNDKIIKTNTRLRYITYDNYCKLIETIDDNMWHCYFQTLYFSGMRKGELYALTWEDINFYSRTITVDKTLSFVTKDNNYKITNTKTYHNREITMSNILYDELLKYKNIVKQYTDFKESWFVFGNGDTLTDYKVSNAKNKYFKNAGLKDIEITIHEFRHSHVSLCVNEYIKSGETDSTKFFLMMSQRMGHSLQVMINTYLHLFPTTQDKIINLLNNL